MRTHGSDASRPLHPALALTATVLGAVLMVAGGLSLARSGGVSLRLQIAVGSALLAAPALLAVALRREPLHSTLALGPVARRLVWLSAALGVALWLGSVGLIELQSALFPPPPEYLEQFRLIHHALRPGGPFDALISVAVIGLAPGLFEELVFRGVLLPSLVRPFQALWDRIGACFWKRRTLAHTPEFAPAVAVVVSALIFAAIHFDIYRFVFTLTMGLVFGTIRLSSGSLLPSVVAHATLNTVTFLVAPLLDDPTETVYTPHAGLGLGCLLIGAALAWPLLRALYHSVDSPPGHA
jgi:membrane protease YdiL (CAAX protease family)